MLIKELRQGMRGKLFVSAFLLIQAAMLFTVLIGMTAGEFGSSIFWVILAVPLLLIIPLTGFGSVHSELRAGTMELVFLTRLSALRIVSGKWVALVSQGVIFTCSVLPYAVLRYFLFSADVLSELLALFILLLSCGFLTALGIAISPIESRWLRPMLLIGSLIGLFFTLSFVVGALNILPGSVSLIEAGLFMLFLVLYYPASLFLALELSATQIAPLAENHATRKRLLGWAVLVGSAIVAAFVTEAPPPAVMAPALCILLIIFLDALCEEQTAIPSLYVPFIRRGTLGWLSARLLAPGWAPGFIYVTVTYFAAVLLMLAATGVHLAVGSKWLGSTKFLNDDTLIIIAMFTVAIYGSLIFPLALLKTVLPRLRAVFAGYVIISIISPFFGFIMVAFTLFNDVKIIGQVLICFSPFTMLWVMLLSPQAMESSRVICLVFSLLAVFIYMAALAYRAMQSFRDVRRGEAIALKVIQDEGKPLQPLPPVSNARTVSVPPPQIPVSLVGTPRPAPTPPPRTPPGPPPDFSASAQAPVPPSVPPGPSPS